MAITVSGTTLTFNDSTTQTSAAGLVTGGSVLNGTASSYLFTGIPSTAKQIWFVFTATYTNTSTERVVIQAQTSGGAAGTPSASFLNYYTVPGHGTSSSNQGIYGTTTGSNLAHSGSTSAYVNNGVLTLTKVSSTAYDFQFTGSTTSATLASNKIYSNKSILSMGGDVARIYIGCTVGSFSTLNAQVYWEG